MVWSHRHSIIRPHPKWLNYLPNWRSMWLEWPLIITKRARHSVEVMKRVDESFLWCWNQQMYSGAWWLCCKRTKVVIRSYHKSVPKWNFLKFVSLFSEYSFRDVEVLDSAHFPIFEFLNLHNVVFNVYFSTNCENYWKSWNVFIDRICLILYFS